MSSSDGGGDNAQGGRGTPIETPEQDETQIETIERFLSQLFFFEDTRESGNKPNMLTENTLEGMAKYILSNKCKNIITLAGAGISTSAGIPDFRSPESGLYNNLQKYNLPEPQAIFDIRFFRQNPEPFFRLAKELYPGFYKPTPSHYFIKLLHTQDKLLRHYTQNIDNLERLSGLPEEKLIEAHGSFQTSHCIDCKKEYTVEWLKEKIFSDVIPMCLECNGIVKPDITFFGESLPSRFYDSLWQDFSKCDLLIVMGSSLEVQPFATLVDLVNGCPCLLINREVVHHRFIGANNGNNVVALGDCDDSVRTLSRLLGWDANLEAMIMANNGMDSPIV